MLQAHIRAFAENETGGGTVMVLLWFAVLVGITGVAVDVTDGFRNRTMLQATADATALAAAIDLPDRSAALATATTYAVDNMGYEINGRALDPNNVQVGRWDAAEQALDANSPVPDSVMVSVNGVAESGNGAPASFLRLIGLQTWNVTARAVAQRFIPECLRDGLIARNIVDMSSRNGFTSQICIHGNKGVNFRGGNSFEPGVNVSMPSLDMLTGTGDVLTSNPGLQDALRENFLEPRMVSQVDEIMQNFLNPASPVIPDYVDTVQPVIEVDETFDLSTTQAGRIYNVGCKPNTIARIPANSTIVNVVIIAECEITIGTGATVLNSVLASRSGGNGNISQADIGVAANVQLGVPDNCTPGGGVQMFSNATIQTAASTSIDGVQMVTAGDIELGARSAGVNGISAQAGGDIILTNDNMFGSCSGGAPDLFTVDYYRLVL